MPKLEGKNALVTGGAGFIGSHLCDSLLTEPVSKLVAIDNLFLGKETNLNDAQKDDRFIFRNLDVTDYEGLRDTIALYKINVIFHFAVIPLEASLEKPRWSFEQNVKMTENISEIVRTADKKITLIACSSSEVYGSALYTPMDENHPLLPHTPYAASKAASDLLVYSYYKTSGIDAAIVRPFNNYGPRQNEGSYAGAIPKTIKRILDGHKPVIYDDGKQTRDFIYVKDTADWTVDIYKNDNTRGEIINIASGKQIPIEVVIKGICKELNYNGEIEYREKRPGDVRKHEGCVRKAVKLLNFKPNVDYSEGIKQTVQWYVDNCT